MRESNIASVCWDSHFRKIVKRDDFEEVPRICHQEGVKVYVYVTLIDEGWPLPPKKVREVSYHNSMHYQHWSRQSQFTRDNPQYIITDRTLLEGYDFNGLFFCLRS